MNTNLQIYTDGACRVSVGQGGLGIVWIKDGIKVKDYSKAFRKATNNQMELYAVILALRSIQSPIHSLTIFSDSMYVIGCASMGWSRKKNKSLWKQFDDMLQQAQRYCETPIVFTHVAGHADNVYNNLCDTLANNASKEFLGNPSDN